MITPIANSKNTINSCLNKIFFLNCFICILSKRNEVLIFDLVIKGGLVLISRPENPLDLVEEQVDIGISDGQIVEIGFIEQKKAHQVFNAHNLHVLPGLFDCQVHFREPGMEHKENFETGSRSALLGGMTGVFEMPNTFPPTTSVEALEEKRRRAKNRFYCDYAFYMGASPENADQLDELEKQPACCGVKVFMGSSTGNLLVDQEKDLEKVVQHGSRRMASHCEDEDRLNQRKSYIVEGQVDSHCIWRDEQTALLATQKLVQFAEKYNRPVHILHVTTQDEIEFLAQHKSVASVEVTPQHLTLTAPECYEKLGTLTQMNPPIRSERHFHALWRGVQNGVVDIIGSDHAPHTLEEKNKTYPATPSGMPGVQTLLPLLLHHRSLKRLDLQTIVRLLAVQPYLKFKMKNRGLIQKGFKANFTIIDSKKKWQITKNWLSYKCGWSPFEGMSIEGWPHTVILEGQRAMQEGEVIGAAQGKEIEFCG